MSPADVFLCLLSVWVALWGLVGLLIILRPKGTSP